MNSILYLFNSITGAGCIQSYTWSSLYSILYLELIVFYSIHGAGIVFWSWLYKIRYLEMVVFKPIPGAGCIQSYTWSWLYSNLYLELGQGS